MNWNRVLGSLLRGGTRPRGRNPRRNGLPMGGGGNMTLVRLVMRLVTAVIQAFSRSSRGAPQRRSQGTAPRRGAAAGPAPARSARLPEWATAPTSVPASAPASPYTPPAGTPDAPPVEMAENLLLIRAMISAAKSDGVVDAEERRAIADQLDSGGLSAAERDSILADFENPLTPAALAAQAADPMMRARLYAGAVAAMGAISPPERAWLNELAQALGLDRQAAAAIEERLST